MNSFRLLPFACCFMLAACGEGQNARDILGLSRNAPDEFKVVSRPPLSVPPDFALRPPLDGDDVTELPPADTAARAMVTGTEEESITGEKQAQGDSETAVGIVQSYDLESQADENFLSSIGAQKADESIRHKLEKESAGRRAEKEERKEKTFGFLQPHKDEDAVIVDPEKEQERLKANEDAGKAVTEGETPVIAPKTKGALEQLF